jgi:uncharacterized protein YoxC
VETLVGFAKVLALLSASALCIYLIVVLVRFSALMQVLQSELVDLSTRLKPVLDNINTIAEKFRSVSAKIEDQVAMVHGIFVAFKRVTDNILQFEERFQRRLEEPLLRVSSLFSNVINRVISFFSSRMQGIL